VYSVPPAQARAINEFLERPDPQRYIPPSELRGGEDHFPLSPELTLCNWIVGWHVIYSKPGEPQRPARAADLYAAGMTGDVREFLRAKYKEERTRIDIAWGDTPEARHRQAEMKQGRDAIDQGFAMGRAWASFFPGWFRQ
jgi:hypothetical protein